MLVALLNPAKLTILITTEDKIEQISSKRESNTTGMPNAGTPQKKHKRTTTNSLVIIIIIIILVILPQSGVKDRKERRVKSGHEEQRAGERGGEVGRVVEGGLRLRLRKGSKGRRGPAGVGARSGALGKPSTATVAVGRLASGAAGGARDKSPKISSRTSGPVNDTSSSRGEAEVDAAIQKEREDRTIRSTGALGSSHDARVN
ncbi:hypothetical protein DID88_009339 [Monilinia fructigena]|uniref:Uncharacterized protein n=1 Tax=Monilinia fructigena TaxID=38457 RepID=A0A395IST6_9HELO|nr:hypothetical protein DID88_009339 [Monilinia fructigena]